MNKIAAWFRSKGWDSHAVAGICLTIAGLITGNVMGCRDLMLKSLAAHPTLGAWIVLIAGITTAKYSRSSSPAGTLATARDIKDSGNAPTAAQVDAASTK